MKVEITHNKNICKIINKIKTSNKKAMILMNNNLFNKGAMTWN
jgi:hypothetical protein